VQVLVHQEGQLVGVLTGGGNPDCPCPVVVEVAEFVSEELVTIHRPTGVVVDDVVMSRRHRSLVRRLGDDVEVVHLGLMLRDCRVDHRAGSRIDVLVGSSLQEEPHRDALRDDDDGQLGIVVRIDVLTSSQVGGSLVLVDVGELTLSDAIAIDDDAVWKLGVVATVVEQRLTKRLFETLNYVLPA